MIEFLNHWGRLWAEYFGMAVVQNTLFLGLIFIILRYMNRRSARIKYIICMVGIFKLLLPPFIPLVLISYTPFPEVNSDISPVITLSPIPGSPEIISSSPVRLNLLGLFFILWFGFLILYLLTSFISTLRLKSKVRGAVHLTDISAFTKDSSSKIHIYKSGRITMPLTLGLIPRRIYVPAVWDQWTEDCRRMVIAHEIAHIKRHDGLFQAFQILAQGIYFFHPLVLLLSQRLKEYREMACDDASVWSQKDSSLKYFTVSPVETTSSRVNIFLMGSGISWFISVGPASVTARITFFLITSGSSIRYMPLCCVFPIFPDPSSPGILISSCPKL